MLNSNSFEIKNFPSHDQNGAPTNYIITWDNNSFEVNNGTSSSEASSSNIMEKEGMKYSKLLQWRRQQQ